MNISHESASAWLNITAYNQHNSKNDSTGSTEAGVTSEDSPSPQVWDLRWFAILSGPLLFGTIILPLSTGPAIRYVCRSYLRHRFYWRLGLEPVALALVIYSYVTQLIYLAVLCDIFLVAFLNLQIIWAWPDEWLQILFKLGRRLQTLFTTGEWLQALFKLGRFLKTHFTSGDWLQTVFPLSGERLLQIIFPLSGEPRYYLYTYWYAGVVILMGLRYASRIPTLCGIIEWSPFCLLYLRRFWKRKAEYKGR